MVVVGVQQQAPGARLQVRRVAAAQLGVFQVGWGVVVQVGEVDAGAAVVARVIVLGQQVEALLVVQLHPQGAEHVDGAVVLQVGLGVVDEDLVAGAIVKGFVLLAGNPQAGVEPFVAATDRLGEAGGQVVAVVEAAAGSELGLEARRARFALLGHDVDDAAGGAAAVDGTGARQHFDALDVERRNAVELARQAARAVLADPVDHHQHIAPAHVLAVVGTAFRRQVEAWHQLADGFLQADAAVDLLAQLLLVDHPHGAGDFADRGAGARGHADLDRLEVDRLRRGVGLAQGHRAGIAEVPAHAAAGQQLLQGLLDAVAALQGRAGLAGDIAGGVQQVQAGLVGEGGQGLVQRLGRQVELDLAGLGLGLFGGGRGKRLQRADQHGQGTAGHQGMVKRTAAAVQGLEHQRHE
ncbi:hypothetical protein D3C78_496820 [compost metagenome]